MIQAFAENLAEAFRAPRLSARRIIAMRPSLADCVLMVALAFVIQSGAAVVIDLVWPSGAGEGSGLSSRLVELLLQGVLYAVLVGGVQIVGRRFGGTATPMESAAVVAWHYVVTAFLAPLNIIGMRAADPESGAPGFLFFLVPFSVALSVWLFAAFVAEAHGFRRIGGVIVATIGGFFALGVIAMGFLALVTGAPVSR